MAYRVRPCRSLDELGRAAGAIGHYFGWVPIGGGDRALLASAPARSDACDLRREGDRRRGRGLPVRDDRPGGPVPVRGSHGRRSASDPSSSRVALADDARADRRHPRARRAVRGALGVRGDDLRPLRLRPRVADARDPASAYLGGAASGISRTRRPGAPGRARRGGEDVSPSVRQGEARDARVPLPLEVLVGEPEAARRSVAASAGYRPAQPRAPRARRAPCRVCALPADPIRGERRLEAEATRCRGARPRPGRPGRSGDSSSRSTGRTRSVAGLLPTDHPLIHLVGRPDHLGLEVDAGLWVRLVDVGASLSARRYRSDSRVTFELQDSFCPWNAGTWTVAEGVAKRSSRRPDLRLDVQSLGAVYLGGFSFAQLSRAGLVEEASRGGLARADALFASDRAPWCPEIF